MSLTRKLAQLLTYPFEVLGVTWAPFAAGLAAIPVHKHIR